MSADKLQICRAGHTTNGFVTLCEAEILSPFVSTQLCGSLSILSNVKQNVLLLSVQYNKAPPRQDTLHMFPLDKTTFVHTDQTDVCRIAEDRTQTAASLYLKRLTVAQV